MSEHDAAGSSGRPAPEAPPGPPPADTEVARAADRPDDAASSSANRKRRRRGSRGGRGRARPTTDADGNEIEDQDGSSGDADGRDAGAARSNGGASGARRKARRPAGGDGVADPDRQPDDLPDRHREGKPRSVEAAEEALVKRKPKIGDTMPAPPSGDGDGTDVNAEADDRNARGPKDGSPPKRKRRRGGRNRGGSGKGGGRDATTSGNPVESVTDDSPIELDEAELERRRGRERKGRPVGRYLMAVHVRPEATQIAVLEGRALIEHYVSRPTDDVAQIHGNIYLGRVQNVLPGMEAAFIDIGTPKNAVLYRGDTRIDPEDVESKGPELRIEQILKARQQILCQVTKNPIAAKGARLTQEVSLPGRFVVLIPDSSTYGISKRLPDDERKRLRNILDKVKPKQHGVIVRTAAENVTSDEIERDVLRLVKQWEQISELAKRSTAPSLLYREPDMALRVIREEFNKEYRKVVIDDRAIYDDVHEYVRSISPALEDRVELYDEEAEGLPLLERFHVHEQLHKALDRKVWLPSGGSLIIEHTEALTVIDVNTGKNVGTSSLEETVYRNNLEAAIEIARQLRLRDIGGIIVIDFIDMEVKSNREQVIRTFRETLARDKTRTQVFDISELGLVEMTRKRIGEGLLESFSTQCAICAGRGVVFDRALLGDEEMPGGMLGD